MTEKQIQEVVRRCTEMAQRQIDQEIAENPYLKSQLSVAKDEVFGLMDRAVRDHIFITEMIVEVVTDAKYAPKDDGTATLKCHRCGVELGHLRNGELHECAR